VKTRLAVVLIVVAVAVVAFVVIRFPGPRKPSAPAPSPSGRKAQVGGATPREAVVRYVNALYKKDFQAAYELLSTESKQVHPYDEFARLAESGGAASLDLQGAQEGAKVDGVSPSRCRSRRTPPRPVSPLWSRAAAGASSTSGARRGSLTPSRSR
jgi:hypothetical protein